MSDIEAFLADRIGYRPRDADLFRRALTHSSAAKDSYERLEFVGDRVLGLVVATALYDRYDKEPEGRLSQRYNVLVARETCADVGRDVGLPAIIRLGKQARGDGANDSDNVVGDVVEALIAALYLDGGLEAAKTFILSQWSDRLERLSSAPKHPKSALQELAAARDLPAPRYEMTRRSGAHHAPRFEVEVSIAGAGEAKAEGASKQDAETAAAAALLEKLR